MGCLGLFELAVQVGDLPERAVQRGAYPLRQGRGNMSIELCEHLFGEGPQLVRPFGEEDQRGAGVGWVVASLTSPSRSSARAIVVIVCLLSRARRASSPWRSPSSS